MNIRVGEVVTFVKFIRLRYDPKFKKVYWDFFYAPICFLVKQGYNQTEIVESYFEKCFLPELY